MHIHKVNLRTIIILLIAMSAMTQAGLVLYTPAFVAISTSLHIPFGLVATTLTGYLFGFGISQLFYGTLSEHFGRKAMLITGLLIFNIGALFNIFVNTYESFLIARILQGIGLGSCMTLSRSILRDCFSGKLYIKVASYLSSGFAIGMGITPVIGGHIVDLFGSWRFEFVFLLLCGVVLLFFMLFFLPETHQQRHQTNAVHFIKKTKADCHASIKNKAFLGYLFIGVMAYSVIVAYNTMTPFIFQKLLGYGASFYGWLTLIVAVVYYIGTAANRKLIQYFNTNMMINTGLRLVLLAGVSMLLLNLVFHSFNLYVVFIPFLIATFGQALIWSNCIAGALEDLSHIAGTASAMFGCLQMLLSALVSGLIAIPVSHNQIPFALVIIALGIASWLGFQLCVSKTTSSKKEKVVSSSINKRM